MKTETHVVIEMGTSTEVADMDDRALAPQADVTTVLETEMIDDPTTETVATGGTMTAIAAVDARPARTRIPKLLQLSLPRMRGIDARCLCSSLLRG